MRRAGPVRHGTVNHVRRGTEQHSADRCVRHSPPVRRVTESRRNGNWGFGGFAVGAECGCGSAFCFL